MPAPDKAKVVFIRPNPLWRDLSFDVRDGDHLIGILPYYSFFEYECAPGKHRFSATFQNDLKVMEADLLPGRIYYAKIAARWGMMSGGVNMYSLYPGCVGDAWITLPRDLAGLKETIVTAEQVQQAVTTANAYLKRVNAYRPNPEAELIRPEHGQTQSVR